MLFRGRALALNAQWPRLISGTTKKKNHKSALNLPGPLTAIANLILPFILPCTLPSPRVTILFPVTSSSFLLTYWVPFPYLYTAILQTWFKDQLLGEFFTDHLFIKTALVTHTIMPFPQMSTSHPQLWQCYLTWPKGLCRGDWIKQVCGREGSSRVRISEEMWQWKQESEVKHATIWPWRWQKGPWAHECKQPAGTEGKDKKAEFSLESQKGVKLGNILIHKLCLFKL